MDGAMTTDQIIRTLTAKRIAARVGVKENAVYNRKSTFPAAWYTGVREMCDEAGIDCPEALFNWSAPKPEHAGEYP